ncbi:MAG: hypothetical protein QOJ65_1211, partial [Fimbriimonadaceae bacterium]|nr:hypothetical protein [Fimbriimonadaceae bacterium]
PVYLLSTTAFQNAQLSFAEYHRIAGVPPRSFKNDSVVGAFPFKGWMVWLYRTGNLNLRHSAVGDPERQSATYDLVINGAYGNGDETRGGNYSMADNFGDSPLAGFACGDVAMYVGSIGVYAQIGDKPWQMTASKKLPGSFGCPNGFACCKWRDASGNPGVAALSRDGEGIYFYAVGPDFDGVHGYRITELSADIRASIRSFLGTDFSNARLAVQEDQDALWVIVGRKAMVLRRPHPLTGERYWEFYQYSMGSDTIAFPAFTARYKAKWMRSNGATDYAERDIFGVPVTGATRDNGAAMPAPYWKSKVFTSDANSRVDTVDIYRETLTNTPSLEAISTRQTTSKTWSSGKRHLRFGALQQGWEHQFKISLGQNDDAYHRINIDVNGPIGKRLNS